MELLIFTKSQLFASLPHESYLTISYQTGFDAKKLMMLNGVLDGRLFHREGAVDRQYLNHRDHPIKN